MKWINASERQPKDWDVVFARRVSDKVKLDRVETRNDRQVDTRTNDFYWDILQNEDIEWLDESVDSTEYEHIQSIYNKHKVHLDCLKEERQGEGGYLSDSDVECIDKRIVELAAVLSDLYRNILHKEA